MAEHHPSHRPGSAPTFASFPARTINIEFSHVGAHEWKNGAEQEWVCADNCPHPDHDDDHGARVATPREQSSTPRDGDGSGSNGTT